jgi:hypothetical protein
MKKLFIFVLSLTVICFSAGLALADKDSSGKFSGKAGDTIYVCACGDSCKCGTIGMKEGNCGCGQKLIKTTVTKVEKDKVFYKIEGKELSGPVQGKYTCGCGEGCDCGFISQKAGRCGCGKDMVKVK